MFRKYLENIFLQRVETEEICEISFSRKNKPLATVFSCVDEMSI